MFWKLIVIATSCSIIVEAAKHDYKDLGQTRGKPYDFHTWKSDVWTIFESSRRRTGDVPTSLMRLRRMSDLEKTVEFRQQLKDVYSLGRSNRIKQYIGSSFEIVRQTSFLRKTKSTTDNLYDIIAYHNGCRLEEISIIDIIGIIYGHKSRISILLDTIKFKTTTYCWINYNDLLVNTKNLLSRDGFDTIIKLSQLISYQSLYQHIDGMYRPRQLSIDLVAQGIVAYLIQIEHPELEDINSKELTEMVSIIEDVYEIEVKHPCIEFCSLLNPIRHYFSNLSRTNFSNYEMLIDFSCGLASLELSEINKIILLFIKYLESGQLVL